MKYYPNALVSGEDDVVRHQTIYDSSPSIHDALIVIRYVCGNYYKKTYCVWVEDDEGNVVYFKNYVNAYGNLIGGK